MVATRSCVAVGLASIAVYFALAAGSTGASVLYDAIGAGAVLAILAGIRWNRPRLLLPWYLFAAGNACFVAGDTIAGIQGDPPPPSVAAACSRVNDTGIGLGPGEGELVFDRFFRSSRAIEEHVPTTRLGLFIARAIAEAHGGTILASSRRDSGTTFRIELPSHVPTGPEATEGRELVA